jgi:hypothetical protein
MMKPAVAALCAAFMLSSCAGIKTPEAGVYASSQALLLLLNEAAVYNDLPTCTKGAVICSDPATVARIQAASAAAVTAADAADVQAASGASASALQTALYDLDVALNALSAVLQPLQPVIKQAPAASPTPTAVSPADAVALRHSTLVRIMNPARPS